MVDVRLLEELRGAFVDGYTSEDIDRAFDLLSQWTGLDLVAFCDQCDEYVARGSSEFGVFDHAGRLFEAPGEIAAWLGVGDDTDATANGTAQDLHHLKVDTTEPYKTLPPYQLSVRNFCYERR